MDLPLVSVLMVSYNSEKFIKEAIESVLRQTYANFELVICDDNSKDGTVSIINSFNDNRVKKIFNEKNIGEYANRDKAISLAKGEYLIFIDGDDIIYPNGLSFMMDFAIKYPRAAMIISRPWHERIIFPKEISPRQFYCFEYLDMGICGINFAKVLFRTDAIKVSPFFPSKVKLGDVYMQYEIGLTNSSVIIPDAATWWRRRAGQASEGFINDLFLYAKHELWIKLDKLNDPLCPLTVEEKELAFENFYGGYMRNILRLVMKLKIVSVINLLKTYPVPFKYIFTIFKRQNRNYFNHYNGDHPMNDLGIN